MRNYYQRYLFISYNSSEKYLSFTLSDIVIVHHQNSQFLFQDHFLLLSSSFVPDCFGAWILPDVVLLGAQFLVKTFSHQLYAFSFFMVLFFYNQLECPISVILSFEPVQPRSTMKRRYRLLKSLFPISTEAGHKNIQEEIQYLFL